MKPVVVIDDDIDVREVIIFALENEGLSVISFANGLEALEKLPQIKKEDYPGFILVDYLMPEMDGLTFIRKIRETYPETIGKIPLALSSAMGQLEEDLEKIGNVSHLQKPMDLEKLLQMAKLYCL